MGRLPAGLVGAKGPHYSGLPKSGSYQTALQMAWTSACLAFHLHNYTLPAAKWFSALGAGAAAFSSPVGGREPAFPG